MTETKLSKTNGGHFLAPDCPDDEAQRPPARVGLDRLDQLPLRTLLDEIAAAADETVPDAVTALVAEGARGAAAQRLLARDLEISRVQLRAVEALKNVELRRLTEGKGNERRVRLLERLVQNQHKRMLASLETMMRMEPSAPVAVKIRTTQAAVLITDGEKDGPPQR